jgi:hypothetical protein
MRDRVDVTILDLDPERSYKSQTMQGASAAQDNGMLEVGLPDGAIHNAMQ